jgi:hypothetical protein
MTNFYVGTFKTKKLSPFEPGLHHFNPPPKASSYKRDNEVLHQIGKILGVEQCVQSQKDKGMQTQYEVNNFSRVTLLSKLNSFSSSPRLGYGPFIAFKWNRRAESERFHYMEGQGSWIS